MTGKANHREFVVLCAVPSPSVGPILSLKSIKHIELNIKVIDVPVPGTQSAILVLPRWTMLWATLMTRYQNKIKTEQIQLHQLQIQKESFVLCRLTSIKWIRVISAAQ